jgi:hypothetical protein
MVESCPVCDTLWRLYKQATDNLQTLVGKHADLRGQGDQNSVEILSHEITIGESTLRAVRRELRRHEDARHANRQENRKSQPKEEGQKPQK